MKPPAVKTKLTAQDIADLDDLEARADRTHKAALEFATVLKEIRDRQLYLRDYRTFEAYLEHRWDISRQRGYQLIQFAAVTESIRASVSNPLDTVARITNEKQVRELAKVPEKDRGDVIARAATKSKEVTGKAIAESAKEIAKEKDAEILDGSGYPVPERLMALWNRASEPETFLKHLADVRGPMRRIMDERKDLLYAECDMGEIMMSLDKAYAQIKRAVPFAVCPTCQGLHPEKCRACKGRGLISRFSWDHGVPQEMKDIRKRSRE